LAVKGDPADVAATPAPKPSATPRPVPSPAAARAPAPSPAANANASANAPLSLSPQGAQSAPAADTRTRVASTNAAQATPSGGGSYVVQVSSQRSEADATASFKALQGKFPSVLGSRAPLIKRADLGDKGVYYRAMVGPFASSEEAAQVCGSLKTAGGQCVVQKN
jgi:cell division septation protein DedD